MTKIIWTQRALSDLENILEYIAKDSVKYSILTIEKLISTTNFLQSNQRIGRIVPELNREDIRELISGNYKIIYRTSSEEMVHILTVHHSSILLKNNPFIKR
ncbi:MAG: type II toxin-antitoxin system RelE/ParE family toxin [Bacteroidales bacterium]|nr:type II toxin-antitoxin system RelE/ParE family toxin [Bacteroidales bacterium]MCF8454386.1 type II toxin-antitoxin system RelE/ParE family toxin [Bacteroidales bacterium]